jgi:hypothetical protein
MKLMNFLKNLKKLNLGTIKNLTPMKAVIIIIGILLVIFLFKTIIAIIFNPISLFIIGSYLIYYFLKPKN